MDVEVRNGGKKDFPIQYNSNLYLVKAGKSRWVPEEALSPQFGYRGAVNTPKHKRRDEEVTRLRVLYGIYDDNDAWEEFKRNFKVEIYDHEGERVWTPLDDPTGSNVRVVDEMDEKDRLEATVTSLMARLDALEGRHNAGPRAEPDVPSGDVPTKLDQPVRVTGKREGDDGRDGGNGDDSDVEDDDDVDPNSLDANLDFQAPEDTPNIIPVDQ